LHCEDYALWLKLGLQKSSCLANIEDKLIFYRKNENGISELYYKDQLKNTYLAFCQLIDIKLTEDEFFNLYTKKHNISIQRRLTLGKIISYKADYPPLYQWRDLIIFIFRKIFNFN
jgi:hypothetical protein